MKRLTIAKAGLRSSANDEVTGGCVFLIIFIRGKILVSIKMDGI